jgi:hypothetical protein
LAADPLVTSEIDAIRPNLPATKLKNPKGAADGGVRVALARHGARSPTLHCGLGIVIGNDGCFECFVIFSILQRADHRLGREPMADGVAARAPFAFFRDRAGALRALRRLASICLKEVMGAQPR